MPLRDMSRKEGDFDGSRIATQDCGFGPDGTRFGGEHGARRKLRIRDLVLTGL